MVLKGAIPLFLFVACLDAGIRPLITVSDADQVGLNKDTLKHLVKQIGDLPVAVIATSGKFRGGKSFFGNVFMDRFRAGAKPYGLDTIIGGSDGIPFRHQRKGHTKGINVWSDVKYAEYPNGKRIAIIYLDCQGTFDTDAERAVTAILFTISEMLSSTLIFNVQNRLDAQDLEVLHEFNMYAKGEGQQIGQNFFVLIRDSTENPGLATDYLETLRNPDSKTLDHVDGAFSAFTRVEAWAVPRPADALLRANFSIRAGDCGAKFLKHIVGFADHVVRTMEPKKVMCTDLNGPLFGQYVEEVVKTVSKNVRAGMRSAPEALKAAQFAAAEAIAFQSFEKAVSSFDVGGTELAKLLEMLDQAYLAAFEVYKSQPRFGSTAEKQAALEEFNAKTMTLRKKLAEELQLRKKAHSMEKKIEDLESYSWRDALTDIFLLSNMIQQGVGLPVKMEQAKDTFEKAKDFVKVTAKAWKLDL
ncbi:unnamed protein product, partial [Mesorhabditis spiculigera]